MSNVFILHECMLVLRLFADDEICRAMDYAPIHKHTLRIYHISTDLFKLTNARRRWRRFEGAIKDMNMIYGMSKYVFSTLNVLHTRPPQCIQRFAAKPSNTHMLTLTHIPDAH